MSSDITGSMLGILPPIVIGGAALMLTERFLQPQVEREQRRYKRRRPFDRQEERDLRPRRKVAGFGDFSNIGW